MQINILKKGDKVISVTSELIAVRRKNGEVDILPLQKDKTGLRIDTENMITISYGSNTVIIDPENDIHIINF